MMPRKVINIDETKDLVLCRLYLHASKEDSGNLRMFEIYDSVDKSASLIDIALDALQSESLSLRYEIQSRRVIPSRGGNENQTINCARITMKGIGKIEKWSDEYYDSIVQSIISSTNNSEFAQYLSTLESVEHSPVKEIPASDRFVTISHNKQYEDTLRTLDDAIRQFKEDHHLDNELGQEKTALVKALEGGRELLEDTKIWIPTAINLLVEPLRRIDALYKRAAVQGTVGAVVYSAIEHVLKLLGLS